jgi:polyribonucleotide nucleotidyltransferase
MAVDSVLNSAFRGVLLEQRPRIDGRLLNQLRDISCAVEVMPTVHGSAYFARGDTHVLSTTTLGSKTDALQVLPISGTGEVKESHFMLHYDFPPYCTGEMGNVTAVNRRMVGHGKLAERAVRAVMPSVAEFPYTVRVFSECTSSNGSSSMASVCSASLALMDAGVPIHAPVAGLSVGLITHESLSEMLPALEAAHSSGALVSTDSSSVGGPKPYVLLKDILGTEDHNGDMDFKIAGSAAGVTAIQLDVKLEGGVPLFMLEEALDVAREGRAEILEVMSKTIASPRDDFKSNAPRAELVQYDPERRSQLTGVGGEMVKYLQELFTVDIDTTVEGVAYIFGKNAKNVSDCRTLVQDIAVLVKVGDVMSAQVLDVKDFGLIVKVNRAQEGLLHVSDISHDTELLKRPLDELFKVGQRLDVKVFKDRQ